MSSLLPKVSVIIPIYCVEQYIERCARSLFEQTLQEMEFIFVDDCTEDSSIEILERVIIDYPNRADQIIILHHSSNQGLPVARQTGIAAATGYYIAHCDSDDWVSRDMYESLYNKAITENADIVVCDAQLCDEKKILIKYHGCYSERKEDFINDMLLQRVPWSVWNKLFRRSLYTECLLSTNNNMGEDMVLTLQLTFGCNKIAYLSHTLYYYYSSANSICRGNTCEDVLRRFNQYYSNILLIKPLVCDLHNTGNYLHAFNWVLYSARELLNGPYSEVYHQKIRFYPLLGLKLLTYKELPMKNRGRILFNYLRDLFNLIKL